LFAANAQQQQYQNQRSTSAKRLQLSVVGFHRLNAHRSTSPCPQALVSMLIFSVNDLQTAIITKSINFSLTKLDSTIR
jgi:hypothetical protein